MIFLKSTSSSIIRSTECVRNMIFKECLSSEHTQKICSSRSPFILYLCDICKGWRRHIDTNDIRRHRFCTHTLHTVNCSCNDSVSAFLIQCNIFNSLINRSIYPRKIPTCTVTNRFILHIGIPYQLLNMILNMFLCSSICWSEGYRDILCCIFPNTVFKFIYVCEFRGRRTSLIDIVDCQYFIIACDITGFILYLHLYSCYIFIKLIYEGIRILAICRYPCCSTIYTVGCNR